MSRVPSCRPAVERLAAYVPGEQPAPGDPAWIKLNTNENPYPPPPEVLEAIRRAASAYLRLYPDPIARKVRAMAAGVHGLPPEAIVIGNGSDELLGIVIRAFVDPGNRVVHPWPTYSLIPVLTEAAGGVSVPIAYGRDFDLPVEAIARARGRLTFVANPNSPSGTWVEIPALLDLAGRLEPEPFVVDEAYADFRGSSSIATHVIGTPNLLVVRTLSKSYALAGLRVGFLIGHPELVSKVGRLKDSYNVGTLPLAGAQAALGARAWMEETARRIRADRDRLAKRLGELGFSVLPSSANFLFARCARIGGIGELRARGIYEELKARRILVRHFDKPGLDDALRISIGTSDEIERLIAALEEILR